MAMVSDRRLPAALLAASMQTADGMMAVDAEQRIVTWNRAATDLLGYDEREAVGRHCYDLLAGRSPGGNLLCCQRCPVFTMVGHGEPVRTFDLVATTRARGEISMGVSTVVVGDGDGRHLLVHLFREASLNQQLRELLADFRTRAEPQLPPQLSGREREILTMLASGASTREIAARLSISVVTVRNHVQHILRKMNVRCRAEAVAVAYRQRPRP